MMQIGFWRKGLVLAGLAFAGVVAASEGGESHATGVNWQDWKAGNEVEDSKSLQRGAANFVHYCLGCHSLRFVRWSRLGKDLEISPALLEQTLLPANAKSTDYIRSSFPTADAEAWFGRAPPDLSLVARSRGTDWVYQFLKGFVADPAKVTGTNNLVLDGASMPAVLSSLEGVKTAVFASHGESGGSHGGPVVERFEYLSQGSLTPEQFDGFVRDTVNFLDYAGDPGQVRRRNIGLWVVLFLLTFTALAWMLKQEYWKDVT
jgi:ubiquinol-cytochrome c reductase cytochrome c1 subunit